MFDDDDVCRIEGGFSPTCGICGQTIDEQFFACPSCGALHHKDCYAYNEGCSVYGCAGAGREGGREVSTSLVSAGRSLAIRHAPEGLALASRSRRLWGWIGMAVGALNGLLVLATGFAAIFPAGFFAAICLGGGAQLVRSRIEIVPGRVRIAGIWGDREIPASKVRVVRVSWMDALFFYDENGNQVYTLKGEKDDIDFAVRVLGNIAGVRVET